MITVKFDFRFEKVHGAFNKFPDSFLYKHLKLSNVLGIHLKRWLTNLYNFRFEWTTTAVIGYTLLKPDCHNWWISKMQAGREDTLEVRITIKFCFKLGKYATETYGILQTAFRPFCMNQTSVFEWHKRFKEGWESMRDEERCGRSREVNRPELIGQTVRVRVSMLRF